jgi:hypothetical protein
MRWIPIPRTDTDILSPLAVRVLTENTGYIMVIGMWTSQLHVVEFESWRQPCRADSIKINCSKAGIPRRHTTHVRKCHHNSGHVVDIYDRSINRSHTSCAMETQYKQSVAPNQAGQAAVLQAIWSRGTVGPDVRVNAHHDFHFGFIGSGSWEGEVWTEAEGLELG